MLSHILVNKLWTKATSIDLIHMKTLHISEKSTLT